MLPLHMINHPHSSPPSPIKPTDNVKPSTPNPITPPPSIHPSPQTCLLVTCEPNTPVVWGVGSARYVRELAALVWSHCCPLWASSRGIPCSHVQYVGTMANLLNNPHQSALLHKKCEKRIIPTTSTAKKTVTVAWSLTQQQLARTTHGCHGCDRESVM